MSLLKNVNRMRHGILNMSIMQGYRILQLLQSTIALTRKEHGSNHTQPLLLAPFPVKSGPQPATGPRSAHSHSDPPASRRCFTTTPGQAFGPLGAGLLEGGSVGGCWALNTRRTCGAATRGPSGAGRRPGRCGVCLFVGRGTGGC